MHPARRARESPDWGEGAAAPRVDNVAVRPLQRLVAIAFVVATSPVASALALPRPWAARSRSSSSYLASLLERPASAARFHMATLDDRGRSMDTLKIVQTGHGRYLGVYHTFGAASFPTLRLGSSADLFTWTSVRPLATHASQGTLTHLSDGGFLLAYESERGCSGEGTPGSCLSFRHYRSVRALRAGVADRMFSAPRTLSRCAEGTPSIAAARLGPNIDHSRIVVRFHYFRNCDVDRQAVGILRNFRTWHARPDGTLNRLIERLQPRVGGNIGDRDEFTLCGHHYMLLEVQLRKHDFGSWRVYLGDLRTRRIRRLDISTPHGSESFGNPTVTVLRSPAGAVTIVATYFVFSEHGAAGERGELVFSEPLAGLVRRARVPCPGLARAARP